LLFVLYEEEFEQSKSVFLPRRNPFQEYDDAKKNPPSFRLSKLAVMKLLDEIHHVGKYHEGLFCNYKIREAVKRP